LALARHKPRRVVMVDIWGKSLSPRVRFLLQISFAYQSEQNPKSVPPAHIYDETTRLYTSGTTGLPKGVPLNNINDILSAHDVIMHFPLTPRDKTMNMSPWFHRGGIHSGGPGPTLYVGGEVVVLRQFTPGMCLEVAEKYQVTFLIGVPSMLKMLHDSQLKHPVNLPKLKGIVTMGAPLEKEACIKYQQVLTPNIFNGYGTSEAFWNTFLRPDDLPEMSGTAGRACTDDDVAVVKVYEDRRAEPDDYAAKDGLEVGEVIVRAPTKTTYAYINSPKEKERAFYQGWIYIGIWLPGMKTSFVTIVGRKRRYDHFRW